MSKSSTLLTGGRPNRRPLRRRVRPFRADTPRPAGEDELFHVADRDFLPDDDRDVQQYLRKTRKPLVSLEGFALPVGLEKNTHVYLEDGGRQLWKSIPACFRRSGFSSAMKPKHAFAFVRRALLAPL